MGELRREYHRGQYTGWAWGFESLPLVSKAHGQVRRSAPRFLATFDFRAAPVARGVIEGINALRYLYRDHKRVLPADAPVAFLRKQWKPYIQTEAGLDRPLYEMAALTERCNSLRSGNFWVPGSRQFKGFEDYLLLQERFATLARDRPASGGTTGRWPSISRGAPGPAHREI